MKPVLFRRWFHTPQKKSGHIDIHIHLHIYIHTNIHIWPSSVEGYETTPRNRTGFTPASYPHQKQTGFIPGFVPRRGSLVSYPVSYLVSYLSRNKSVEAHGEPRPQEKYLPNSCPENPRAVSYRFHTRLHTRSVQTKPFPNLALMPAAGFIHPVSYSGPAACGFMPRFHTGFIPPVSYPGCIPVSCPRFQTPVPYRFRAGFIKASYRTGQTGSFIPPK